MDVSDDLEDLCALAAIAATVPSHRYPEWSDGYENHMAAIPVLWRHLRPKVARHRCGAIAIDLEVRAMMAAFNVGNGHEVEKCAVRLYRAIRQAIDRQPARWPWPFLVRTEAISTRRPSKKPADARGSLSGRRSIDGTAVAGGVRIQGLLRPLSETLEPPRNLRSAGVPPASRG